MKKWLPIIITAVFALWIASSLRAPRDKGDALAVREFGRLPAVSNGRFQPLDSLARNSLLQLREKQTANVEPWKVWNQKPQILSATEWLLAMLFNPALADTWPVIRIDNPDLKGLLALPMDADREQQRDGKHFSWNQIRGKLVTLRDESTRAGALDQSHRTPFDQAVIRLWSNTSLYLRLQNAVQPRFEDFVLLLRDSRAEGTKFLLAALDQTKAANASDWPAELRQFLANVEPGIAALRAAQAGQSGNTAALDALKRDLARFEIMGMEEQPLLIPPARGEEKRDEWLRSGAALMDIVRGEQPSFALLSYAKIAGAYRSNDVPAFNTAVREYRGLLDGRFTPELAKGAREQRFNQFEPFYKAMIVYVAALLCALAFWVRPLAWEWLRRTAVWLVALGLVVHASGLIFRMVLEGRPPVTNLYSSAIFIGLGAVVLGLILERFWRNGVGIVVSSVVGFITLIIAHHLSLSGDTMEMMRAVLDTNFWLATHVVVVTLGYASTYVAGFLAIIYVLRGFFTAGLDSATAKSLVKMIYGIVCFATLFSFVGTVLGGIWADQSWGRFWGWDPKENGALIIVLWNALILHARWGGLVRERGLVNLAIVGNIVTSWSWFGVNMLGIGLHSYGFMDAAFRWLMSFVILQLVLVGIGALPPRFWRSFRGNSAPPSVPKPQGAPLAV